MNVTSEGVAPAAGSEKALALQNAVKLALSLAATLVVAFSVRVFIPRFLGPAAFGQLHFAESFATTVFVFTVLGIDVYIRKEVATRIEHANDFFVGVLVVRGALSLGMLALMAPLLWAMGKSEVEWRLAYLFAGWQMAFVLNNTLAALLHARGTIDGLAVINTGMKLLWAVGVGGALFLRGGAEAVALVFFVSEALKSVVLLRSVRNCLGVTLRLDLGATRAVLWSSAPFFIHYLAHQIYARVDVQMLSVLTADSEVGWYGAAANLALAGMLLLPVVNAVVLPMGARLREESEEAMNEAMRQAVRLVMVGGALVALLLFLYAPALVRLCFGEGFESAARTLQILAPMFPLTYVAVLTSLHLIQLGRVWTVTKISLVGLALNPVLNLFSIPAGWELLGDGGAGVGAAAASVVTELVITAVMLVALGRAAVDRSVLRTALRVLLLSGCVVAVHVLLAPLGVLRAPLEIAVFVLGGTGLGIVPLGEIAGLVGSALTRRRSGEAATTEKENH